MKFPILLTTLALSTAAVRAQTAEKLPDLQVVLVQTVPLAPVAGDIVRLRVVVKNVGEAPTNAGTIIGGEFRLNKASIGFTDTYSLPLAPGETVVLEGNGGGGASNGTWTAREGTFSLGFVVDDAARIRESREDNNNFTDPTPVVVRAFAGPDLVVSRLAITPGSGRVTLRALVKNEGAGATLPNVPVEVGFALNGKTIASARLNAPLLPGQSAEVAAQSDDFNRDARTMMGTRIITARADPNGAFGTLERRRDNNEVARTFAFNLPTLLEATSAARFADSVGVCTHLGSLDTTYGQFDIIKARLLESNIKWIRDGVSPDNTLVIGRMLDLGKAGVHLNLLLDARSMPPQTALALARELRPVVGSIEGQNEPNVFTPELFPDGIRAHQDAVFTAFKTDPELRDLPILSPSLAFPVETAGALGTVRADVGALHPYPGGQLPDTGLDEALAATRVLAPSQPLQITETGYTTATDVQSGQPGVSERAQAKYLLRQAFEASNRGIERTFFYEFADEKPEPASHDAKQRFGLIRADGSPKPAFFALKNLLSLLAEPRESLSPLPLGFSLSGETSNLRSALLQKADGRRFLVMWINARAFDLDTRRDTAVFAQPVTLRFSKNQRATVYRPTFNAQPATATRTTRELSLALDDELTVVELGS